MVEDTQVALYGYEGDPEKIDKGEKAFHQTMYAIQQHVDPAYSFILYQFNRVGIQDPERDAVCYIDTDGTPTIGINYEKFADYSPVTRIGIIEHVVGHFMSGHVGNRLGLELQQYCEMKYGIVGGRMVYHTAIEAVADSFVTYPKALKEDDRPYYDVRKLGLDRWDHTLQVFKKMEELIDEELKDNPQQDPMQAIIDALSGAFGTPVQGTGGSNTSDIVGGANTKDVVMHASKKDAMMGEDNVRKIVKRAIESTEGIKERGWMEGDASQFIEADDVEPVVPWFDRLNHSVSAAVADERRISKSRMNRRNPEYGFGRVHENTTSIALLIDTSGSMSDEELSKVNSQADYMAQQCEELHVVHADAGVGKSEVYRRGMELNEFFGRGGTTFDPALNYVRDELSEELGGMPDAVVYYTDGYGNKLDDTDPIISDWETNLVWVLTPSGMDEDTFRERITKLGTVIKMENEDGDE